MDRMVLFVNVERMIKECVKRPTFLIVDKVNSYIYEFNSSKLAENEHDPIVGFVSKKYKSNEEVVAAYNLYMKEIVAYENNKKELANQFEDYKLKDEYGFDSENYSLQETTTMTSQTTGCTTDFNDDQLLLLKSFSQEGPDNQSGVQEDSFDDIFDVNEENSVKNSINEVKECEEQQTDKTEVFSAGHIGIGCPGTPCELDIFGDEKLIDVTKFLSLGKVGLMEPGQEKGLLQVFGPGSSLEKSEHESLNVAPEKKRGRPSKK